MRIVKRNVKASRHHGLSEAERFWMKVDRRGARECWPWLAGRDRRGYGRFRADKAPTWAHKYALEQKLGRPLRPRMETLHSCDRNWCCNPAHLTEGTHEQNLRDMHRRGRWSRRKGRS